MSGPTCETPVEGTCPRGTPGGVCLAMGSLIATPRGAVPVLLLAEGDLVYSIHEHAIRVVPVLRTRRVPVSGHTVLRVELEGGARLELSGTHPTADGRRFDALRAGDRLSGVPVRAIARVPYHESHTYDLLPDSDSGLYFIAGVPVRSTIAR